MQYTTCFSWPGALISLPVPLVPTGGKINRTESLELSNPCHPTDHCTSSSLEREIKLDPNSFIVWKSARVVHPKSQQW